MSASATLSSRGVGNRDELETVGVPVLLMVLIAATIGISGLNTELFWGMNQLFSLLPAALWANLTILGDALVSLALLSLLSFRYPQLLTRRIAGGNHCHAVYPQPEIAVGTGTPFSHIGRTRAGHR